MSERYRNKRMLHRKAGKFFAPTAADVGIGTCPACKHLMVRVYDGDPNTQHPNPCLFRMRCFNCEPHTEAELKAIEEKKAAEPEFSLKMFFDEAAKS